MIDREQVLHVARLARLELTDEEVERMSGELTTILDHVERMNELDLDGVEPTSHVVALENVLRADEPRPSWPREQVLEPAPDPAEGAFRVPSPAGVSADLLELSVAEALRRIEAGDLAADEYFDAYARAGGGRRARRLPVASGAGIGRRRRR